MKVLNNEFFILIFILISFSLCESPGHCQCKNETECRGCEEGYYDLNSNCTKECNKCPDKKCDFNDGKCQDQEKNCIEEDTFDEFCIKKCSEKVKGCSKCHRGGACFECSNDHYYGPNCKDKCDKCPESTCDFDGKCNNQDEFCGDNTYTGIYCNKTCSSSIEKCLECRMIKEECIKCQKSFYDTDCELTCLNCPGEECHNNGNCTDQNTNCKNNATKGVKCEIICSDGGYTHCEQCDRKGKCLKCQDNIYYGEHCEYSCPNCPESKCDPIGKCIDTTEDCTNQKYYGDYCNISCSTINDQCETCNRQGNCLSCIGKLHYGPKCSESCGNCPGKTCYFDNGTCINDGECEGYKYHGNKCQSECKSISDLCSLCFRNDTCKECSDGKHFGKECKEICDKCPNSLCDIYGICNDTTSDCQDNHFYGDNCNVSCKNINEHCVTCSRNKICSSCLDNKYWGDHCEKECKNCPWNVCHKNGSCIDQTNNCIDPSKTGDKCDEDCTGINENCLYCNRKKKCFECKNKIMFGNYCNISCSNCPGNGTCDNGGICYDTQSPCKDSSFTGANCSVLCSNKYSNCKTCYRNNTCTSCFIKTFFGGDCNKSCDNCPGEPGFCDINVICDDKTANCDNNIYTGANCSVLCSDRYPNCITCNRNNTCLSCFNRIFFGEDCNKSCDNCPGAPGFCDINGICLNKTAKCDNDSYTGANCSVLCSVQYPNCKTCDRNNTCTSCYNQTFYGGDCNKSCDNCPGDPGFCDINGICLNETGICDNDSFTGANCSVLYSVQYPNCKKCNRNNTCLSCFNQTFFGGDCKNNVLIVREILVFVI